MLGYGSYFTKVNILYTVILFFYDFYKNLHILDSKLWYITPSFIWYLYDLMVGPNAFVQQENCEEVLHFMGVSDHL